MPSQQALYDASNVYDAIIVNSHTRVKSLLSSGAVDPNILLVGIMPYFDSVKRTNEDGEDYIEKPTQLAYERGVEHPPSLLHLAVKNCHRNYLSKCALDILDTLLEHGASLTQRCGGAYLVDIKDYNWHEFNSKNTTPMGLAVFLKNFLVTEEHGTRMNAVIRRLQKASDRNDHCTNLPTVRLLKSVADTYEKMLFSEKFSDIKFVCPNGTTFPAHRNVLAASSPYFDTALQGPWAESNSKEWKTAHPPHIIKFVLTLLYQGRIDDAMLRQEARALFEVASEYDLPTLKRLAENSCIQSLSIQNVKEMLQLAHLHNNAILKNACFAFVQRKAAAVLTNPSMMTLAGEDPVLWEELTNAIVPTSDKENCTIVNSSNQNNKRPRLA